MPLKTIPNGLMTLAATLLFLLTLIVYCTSDAAINFPLSSLLGAITLKFEGVRVKGLGLVGVSVRVFLEVKM